MTQKALQTNGWLSVPWAEYLTKKGSTQQIRLGYESGNSGAYSILVYWADRLQAAEELLGTNIYQVETGKLSRVPPKRHPDFRSLFCMSIASIVPLAFVEKAANAGYTVSNYDLAVITCQFAQPKWHTTLSDALTDLLYPGAIRAEWRRFVSWVPQGGSETITHLPGLFVWAEGSGGTTPTINSNVTSSLAQQIMRTPITLVWHRVPARGLFATTSGLPDYLLAGTNKVNDAAFLGFPAETLLFQSWTLRPIESPDIDAAITLTDKGDTPIMYDVVMNFVYRDPPQGGATRGWNLAPYSNQLWYRVQDTTSKSRTLLNTYDFQNLFKMSP